MKEIFIGDGVGISIHAPLAGSDRHHRRLVLREDISIHAPLAGSDLLTADGLTGDEISIHAPLAGSDYHHAAG